MASWFYYNNESAAAGVGSSYDAALSSLTPIVSTYFAVDGFKTRLSPFSESWIGCLRPTIVAAGSRNFSGNFTNGTMSPPEKSMAVRSSALDRSLWLGLFAVVASIVSQQSYSGNYLYIYF